jgi:hypothetical protein
MLDAMLASILIRVICCNLVDALAIPCSVPSSSGGHSSRFTLISVYWMYRACTVQSSFEAACMYNSCIVAFVCMAFSFCSFDRWDQTKRAVFSPDVQVRPRKTDGRVPDDGIRKPPASVSRKSYLQMSPLFDVLPQKEHPPLFVLQAGDARFLRIHYGKVLLHGRLYS